MQINKNITNSMLYQPKSAADILAVQPEKTQDKDNKSASITKNPEQSASPLYFVSGGLQPQTSQTLFQTQQIAVEEEPQEPEEQSAAEKFLEYMDKSTAELWRERILERLGLTEESLKNLPPEEREKMEKKIIEMIREEIEKAAEKKRKDEANQAKQDVEQAPEAQTKEAYSMEMQTAESLKDANPNILFLETVLAETKNASLDIAKDEAVKEKREQDKQKKEENPTNAA